MLLYEDKALVGDCHWENSVPDTPCFVLLMKASS